MSLTRPDSYRENCGMMQRPTTIRPRRGRTTASNGIFFLTICDHDVVFFSKLHYFSIIIHIVFYKHNSIVQIKTIAYRVFAAII